MEHLEEVAMGGHGLLGRDGQLEVIGQALRDAAHGAGMTYVLEGPAGIGKTALARAATELAGEAGWRSTSARGNDGEGALAFGVVRQLLEALLRREPQLRDDVLSGSAELARSVLSPAPGLGSRAATDPFAVLHGLFWVCSNLAEDRPLLLVVDDLHWADPASVRFLDYLTNRIADLPCALLCTYRTGEPVPDELCDTLRTNSNTRVLDLAPLSEAEAAALVRRECGDQADDAFCRACRIAAGGNPFLLSELVRAVVDDGAPLHASAVASVTPAAVLRTVSARLGRLPDEAAALAEALAVAGARSDLHLTARVGGLDATQAAAAADALAGAGLVTGGRYLDFVHPLIRTAVYERMGPGRRATAHAIAATALVDAKRPSEDIANHLLHIAPAGDAARARILARAGEEAVRRGAPEAAVRYLRRALEEPPAAGERGAVLFELGRTEAALAASESLEHLAEATELAPDMEGKVTVLRETAYAMVANFGLVEEAIKTMTRARELAVGHGGELELQAHADQATFAAFSDEIPVAAMLADLEPVADRLRGETVAECSLMALLAWSRMLAGRPAPEVRQLAVRALDGGRLIERLGGPSLTVGLASWALAVTFSRAELELVLPTILGVTRRNASRHGIGIHAWSAAYVAATAGDLRDADALYREGLDALTESSSIGVVKTLAAFLDVRCVIGEADEAWATIEERGFAGELPEFYPWSWLRVTRGRVRALHGDTEGALEDIMAAGARFTRWGAVTPALGRWRAAAAEVHMRRGEYERAAVLLREELALARVAELPFVVGSDLRLLGQCEDDLELLHEAVAVLEPSGARLEYAHALVDLGAAIRRANRRGTQRADVDEARGLLRAGIDIGHHCGAMPLVRRGQDELRATGARPRRLASTGPDALTASERRVAQLAAEGLSNREIAGGLFVTLKTVEKHLGNAYGKLQISSRSDLVGALEARPAPGDVPRDVLSR